MQHPQDIMKAIEARGNIASHLLEEFVGINGGTKTKMDGNESKIA